LSLRRSVRGNKKRSDDDPNHASSFSKTNPDLTNQRIIPNPAGNTLRNVWFPCHVDKAMIQIMVWASQRQILT
jgi:hypothetical protein